MNFQDILKTKVEDIERPPLPPLGIYRFAVTKMELGEVSSAKGEWDTVSFTMQALEPVTVDPDAFAAYGGDVKNIVLRNQFMFDRHDAVKQDQTKFRLRTFLEKHLGMAADGELAQMLNAAVGNQCLGQVKYRPDPNDPEIQYADLGKTMPIE